MFLTILIRSIVGAIVGAIIGYTLSKISEWHEDRQLERMKKRTDEAIANAFAPIRELDSRRW